MISRQFLKVTDDDIWSRSAGCEIMERDISRKYLLVRELPADLPLKALGEHNRANGALALYVVCPLGIEDNIFRVALEDFIMRLTIIG